MADRSLLEVSNIETCYGLSQVLFGVSLAVAPGEMVTLMGRNGMGKTGRRINRRAAADQESQKSKKNQKPAMAHYCYRPQFTGQALSRAARQP